MEENMTYADDDLVTNLGDPRWWARSLLNRAPDQVTYLEQREFAPGTFGAWVKEGLRAEDQERTLAALEELWNAPSADLEDT
jgi:hypothetical protein